MAGAAKKSASLQKRSGFENRVIGFSLQILRTVNLTPKRGTEALKSSISLLRKKRSWGIFSESAKSS
jgi:hypothetical protein